MAVTAIVSLSDVLPELNIAQTPADGGIELQGFIDAASVVIEDMVGHVINNTTTEYYDGGDSTLYLRQVPVMSITTIVETIGLINYTLTNQPVGSPVDNFGYTLDDPKTGRVTRRSAGSSAFPFYKNVGNVAITYIFGRATVPANIRLGTLELIRFMYQQGQQGTRPAFGAPSPEPVSLTPTGYLVPNRVKELCQPSMRPIAMA